MDTSIASNKRPTRLAHAIAWVSWLVPVASIPACFLAWNGWYAVVLLKLIPLGVSAVLLTPKSLEFRLLRDQLWKLWRLQLKIVLGAELLALLVASLFWSAQLLGVLSCLIGLGGALLSTVFAGHYYRSLRRLSNGVAVDKELLL